MKKIKFKYWLRRADLFGVPISFIGAHRLYYQTKLGGIISILVAGLLIYLIITSTFNMINKIDFDVEQFFFSLFQVESVTLFSDEPQNLIINQNNFLFAAQINQQDYLQNPHFLLKLFYVSNDNRYEIPLISCTISMFEKLNFYDKKMEEQLKTYDLYNFLCPDFSNNEYNIQGKYNSKNFEYFKLAVIKCQENLIENLNYKCPQWDETLQYLDQREEELSLNFIMGNINIQAREKEDHLGIIDSEFFVLFNPLKQIPESNIFLSQTRVLYEEQFLIQDNVRTINSILHNRNEFQNRNLVKDYNEKKGESYEFAKIYIRSSQYSQEIKKTYQKIGDLLSYLGGLFNSIYVGFGLILAYYTRYQLWLKLFKINYTIIYSSYSNRQMNHKNQRFTNLNIGKQNDKTTSDRTKTSLQNLVKDKYHPENTLIPKMKHIFGLLTCSKKYRIQAIGFLDAISIIERDLNIVQYFKLQQDVQKIKQIILDEKQTKIFDLQQRQTLIMKDGHFKLNDQITINNNELKRATIFTKVGLDDINRKDQSDLLDQHKKHLYGGGFQEKILQEYLQMFELLLSMSQQRIKQLKTLQRLNEKPDESFYFQQAINRKVLAIFDDDIQDIISKDQQLYLLWNKTNQVFGREQSERKNQQQSIEMQVLNDDQFDDVKVLSTNRLEQSDIEDNNDNDLCILHPKLKLNLLDSNYVQEQIINKMREIHGLVFQRDLTRLFSVEEIRNKEIQQYQSESLESLIKTIFFREEKVKVIKELVIVKYKSSIMKKEIYMPQLIQYMIQFKLNGDSPNLKQQIYKLKLKIKTKNIVQINKMAIEEFLLNNSKQLNAKHVTIEVLLGQENSKYGKYNLMIYAKIKNLNIKKNQEERNLHTLFQQLIKGSIKLSFLKEGSMKNKSNIYLNNSLTNFLEQKSFDLLKSTSLYENQNSFKSHFYLFLDKCQKEQQELVQNSLYSVGFTMCFKDVQVQKIKSIAFGQINQMYEQMNLADCYYLKYKYNCQINCELALEVQFLKEDQCFIHLILSQPRSNSEFYRLLNSQEQNFEERNEENDEELRDLSLFNLIEFLTALFVNIQKKVQDDQ